MHHAGLTESDRKIVEVLFVKKKRNAAAEMLAASSRNKPKKKPQKYLAP